MEKYIVEGNISVKACLLANRRQVLEIFVDKNKKDKDTSFILKQAEARNVQINKVNREIIDEMASGKTHGGLVAYVSNRQYQTLEDITSDDPFIAIVEGIEDPFNFGYICRNLYAAGCDALIVPTRNYSQAVTTVTKSSAGASEYLSIIESDDIPSLILQLKDKGCKLYCAMRKDAQIYSSQDYTKGCILALGGEKRGLSKQILELSDQNIYIEYANDFRNALNGSSATAILAFEVNRQRLK